MMRIAIGRTIGAILLFAVSSQTALAFDTCVYVDQDGAVLRLESRANTAELTLHDGSVIRCTMAAHSPEAVGSGTCEDQPDRSFAVFTAASDPSMDEDDLLVFRDQLWYRKCGFTR